MDFNIEPVTFRYVDVAAVVGNILTFVGLMILLAAVMFIAVAVIKEEGKQKK